ncbi:MAG TPA: hypothetical protein VMR41_02595 [Patescibacteria group bacterium]|nr:hypothetical protein [Patescibacteria group bacterium]
MTETKKEPQQGLAININLDTTPVLYTDNILMNTNEDGVILNIGQMIGTNQLRVVARVGMSRSHAKKFLKELGKLLALTEGQSQTGEKVKN